MKTKLFISALCIWLVSCNFFTAPATDDTLTINKNGMNSIRSKYDFETTYTTLKTALEGNPNIGIMAEINHAANAASVDLTLDNTRIIFFGNPNLGTPLMQRNQLAGLDLPQKILVHQNDTTQVQLTYNSTAYLSDRHGLEGIPTLAKITGALANLSAKATGDGGLSASSKNPSLREGIVTKIAKKSFENTYSSLRTALENNPNLRIIAEVDHSANAAKNGLELRPTRLIIFGNPKLGTPLMQNTRTTALDLPQKMLIWEDENAIVHISYTDPNFLVQRHGITDNEAIIEKIKGALNALSNVAVGA